MLDMLFVRSETKVPYVCTLCDRLKQSNAGKSFKNILWTIAIPVFGTNGSLFDVLPQAPASSRSSAGCAVSLVHLFFLGWHNAKVFAIPPAQRPMPYLSVPRWWSEKYEPARCLAVLTELFFAYCTSALYRRPANRVLWNVPIETTSY